MSVVWHEAYPTRVGGQVGNMTLYDVLDYGYDLGLADYPIWDEGKRKWLNDRIIDHFMLREIGCETPTQFIFYLNRKMREKMPPINTVFAYLETVTPERIELTNQFENNTLGTVDQTATGNVTGTTDTTGEGHSYTSTNPRQTMVGKDATAYYDAGTFTDSTSHNEQSQDSKNDSNSQSTGKQDGRSKAILPTDATNKWWLGINNALELVFDALEPCFSHIWTDHFNTF